MSDCPHHWDAMLVHAPCPQCLESKLSELTDTWRRGVQRQVDLYSKTIELQAEHDRLLEFCSHAGLLKAQEEHNRVVAERDRLLALVRDLCMGHADDCSCRACAEAFRRDDAQQVTLRVPVIRPWRGES